MLVGAIYIFSKLKMSNLLLFIIILSIAKQNDYRVLIVGQNL